MSKKKVVFVAFDVNAPTTLKLAVLDVPDTFRDVSTPTLVMFGWAGWETTMATVAFATLPVTFEPIMFEIADPFEAVSSP